jgi:HAD superfamily hydrolase (TIGR01509 family)
MLVAGLPSWQMRPLSGFRDRLAHVQPRAVIFDLDGTLTEPLLDFDLIRAEIGLPHGPILEQLTALTAEQRGRAETILRRHELTAIAQAVLADGCVELLALLRARGIPHGILTRNMRVAVEQFCARFGFQFAGTYTREDGPHKPAPDGVLHLCAGFGVAPAQTLTVGDYKFDVMAGRAAGTRTALVTAQPPDDLAAWGQPDLVVASLRELLPLWAAER